MIQVVYVTLRINTNIRTERRHGGVIGGLKRHRTIFIQKAYSNFSFLKNMQTVKKSLKSLFFTVLRHSVEKETERHTGPLERGDHGDRSVRLHDDRKEIYLWACKHWSEHAKTPRTRGLCVCWPFHFLFKIIFIYISFTYTVFFYTVHFYFKFCFLFS